MTFASSLPPTSLSDLGQPVRRAEAGPRSEGGFRVAKRGGKNKHALLPRIPGAQRARDCGQSRKRPERRRVRRTTFPRSLAGSALFILCQLDHSILGLLGRLQVRQAKRERGTWTPPRPLSVEERPPWQGGTPAVAPAPARGVHCRPVLLPNVCPRG